MSGPSCLRWRSRVHMRECPRCCGLAGAVVTDFWGARLGLCQRQAIVVPMDRHGVSFAHVQSEGVLGTPLPGALWGVAIGGRLRRRARIVAAERGGRAGIGCRRSRCAALSLPPAMGSLPMLLHEFLVPVYQ